MDYKNQILAFRKKLDEVSETVCLAKWYHVTFYLHQGLNHSCYHPYPHSISTEDIAKNPSALHNTREKKQARKEMLSGKRPEECKYCWAVEDLKGKKNHISDRLIKSFEQGQSRPELLEKLKKAKGSENVNPTVIEISFSNVCNFKCVYCHPKASSKWVSEILEYGTYQGLGQDYQIPSDLIKDEVTNPYVKAWKEWWPQIRDSLDALRITGGEPLLHKTTFDTLEQLENEPAPQLYLMLNSNLGVKQELVEKFAKKAHKLVEKKNVSGMKLYTSLESIGAKAEYARFGLKVETWKKNLEIFLKMAPQAQVSLMCTYNILCVDGFNDFLKLMLDLRKKYCVQSRRIEMDISHLVEPSHLLMTILPEEHVKFMEISLEFMRKNHSDTDPVLFDSVEIGKMERIRDYFLKHRLQGAQQLIHARSLKVFLEQADQRRGTDYQKTFPSLVPFLEGIEIKRVL